MSDSQLAFEFQPSVRGPSAAGVCVRTAARLDQLFESFAKVITGDPLPPYEQEIVCIPHGSALRQWLQQKLANRIGCAASLYTPTLREYGDALIRQLLGEEPSALDQKALTWRIFAILQNLPASGSAVAPLRAYLRRSGGDAMPLARRLAALFDLYQTFRPALLTIWRKGATGSGAAAWQAWIWREVVSDGAGEAPYDRPMLLARLLERLSDHPPPSLPRRISLLGETVVPPVYLDLVNALAQHANVMWYAVLHSQAASRHPLVEILGEDVREAVRLWNGHLEGLQIESVTAPHGEKGRQSALTVLQKEIRQGRQRARSERFRIAPDDLSVRIHDCHSPIRELEVLRDQLLEAFDAAPDLRPSDVLVLVPNLDTYAALVEAVFSAGDEEQRLPSTIARDPREEGRRYLTAFLSLLETAASRLTAGSILELLSEPVIASRATLDSDAVEVIRSWIRATHIRWGADGSHRRRFGLPDDDLHTWGYGLDRLLMGVVTGETDDAVDDVLPYAEDTLDRATILGKFTMWMQALIEAADQAQKPRSLVDWRTWLESLIRSFMSARSDDEQMAEDYLLGRLREMTEDAPDTVADFVSVRSYLTGTLTHFEGRGRLLSGGITVAEPERLRSVPARVVACVGLNDEAFPRRRMTVDFDRLSLERADGDPDPRRLDKQLFLDLLLAAKDRLILTYSGRSQKDNSERAPSIVIDTLLETCSSTFTAGASDAADDARLVREHFVVQHPLQPFSPRYFDGSDPRLFSYDRANCIKPADALTAIPAFVPEVLAHPEHASDVISLRDVIYAWSNPSRFFCESLGLDLKLADLEVEDVEPHYLDGLDHYRVSQRILELLLEGETEERVQNRLRMEGSLPSGTLGRVLYEQQRGSVEPLRQRVDSFGERRPVEIDLPVSERRLVGRIPYVTDRASLLFRPATVKAKDQIDAWIRHLALAGSGYDVPTHLIGREEAHVIDGVDDPISYLIPLVERIDELVRRPLPLFAQSSLTFASRGDLAKAMWEYDGNSFQEGDCSDAYVRLLHRHHHPISEHGDEFAREARSLWAPILKHTKSA